MFDSNMSWYVKGDILQILRNKRRKGRGGRFGPEVGSKEINDNKERSRLWKLAVEAFPPYQEYQEKTERTIPVFLAE